MAPSKTKKRKLRPAPLSLATEAFLRADEYAFQCVTAEAYSHEPDIDRCSIYGTRGQMQHGIDVIGYRRDGPEIELVQCRRYAVFGVPELKVAIHDFVAEGKRWNKEKVRRFVVATSADISDRHLQDAILAARRKFRKKKIIFGVWGGAELCIKLKPHRSAVQQIYGGDGADRICGPVPSTAAWLATERLVRENVGNALVELESERSAELEELRELSREGRHDEALKRALAIKRGSAWAGYTPELRARFLRFEASMRLNLGEPVAEPSALVAQAKALHPQLGYQVIESYVVAHRDGIVQALAHLEQPASLDAWNMRWALLLERGRANEVAAEFKARGPTFTPNADTRRLLALAALLTNDLTASQAEIARAQALGPKHHSIRLAAAIIDYRSCLAPSADAGPNLTWPTPVRWAFVRRDPPSLDRLRRATAEFAALRASAVTREAGLLEVWELGCLACDPTRAAEAEAYAQGRLKAAPEDFRVAAWAVERDYQFDRAVVAAAIATAIERDPKIHLDAHFARCSVLLADRQTKAAEKALDEAEEAFQKQGQHDVWKVQKVQFLVRRKRPTAKLIGSIADANLRSQARMATFRIGKSSRADLRRLAEQFADEYAKSGSPSVLFNACDAYYRADEPKFIAQHARELVDKVGTDAALRLALHGTFAAEQPDLCLELLREKQAVLQGGKLSPELRRLHAACLQKLGQLEEAIRAAEALYRERPEPGTFAEYFRILIQSGDTPGAAVLARDLLTLPKVDVVLLLQVANFTRLQDMTLAQQLWRKAAAKPLKTTQLLMGVVGLAFTLGTENEARGLQRRLFKRARKKGPIQLKTLDEIREMVRERQEQQAKLSTSYDRSETPIHIIATPVGAPLVQLYHSKLAENRAATDLTLAPALLARYGGRTFPQKFPKRVLYTDITGLILATDLGILDLVEEHLGPIYLAPEAPQSLVQQVGECRPHQPTQHAWRAQLDQMVKDGEVVVVDGAMAATLPADHPLQPLGRDWQDSWQTAQDLKAVLGTDWPLHTEDLKAPVTLPEDWAKGTANLRELVVAAQAAGAMSAEDLAEHVGAVGVFRTYPVRAEGPTSLAAGTTVLLPWVPLEILANQGLLKAVAKAFRVRITRADFDRIAAEERGHAKRMALADWTQALLDRVKAGIAAGRYKVLPQSIPAKQLEKMNLDAKGLANLLRAVETNAEGSLWCDDRAINRHALAGTRPSVDILEVMGMLESAGKMTEAERWEKLTHLRRSNVRYVPTSTEEIFAALNLAAIDDGELVETAALSALRRYYAACLLEKGRLVGPQQGTRDLQEWNFILQVRQATDGAFRKLWELDLPVGTIEAQANWLWRWLYVDMVGLRVTVMKDVPVAEERELTAFQIGSLFSLGITVPFRPRKKGEPSVRDRYFGWLNRQLLAPLEHSNPGFIESVGRIVARDIERTCRGALKLPEGDQRKGQLLVMTKLFMDLPLELREQVNLPADVLAAMAVKVHGPGVGLEGRQFDLATFCAAQAEALAKGTAKLVDRDRKVEWKLDREPGLDPVLKVTFPDSAVKIWQDPEFAVLVPEMAERMERLEKLAFWFDCDQVTRRAAVQEICDLEKPADRVLRLHQWKDGSATFAYRELNRLLQANSEIEIRNLQVPDWRRLLQHLRLPVVADDAVADLDASAQTWLKEEGLLAALRCFMALPRLLPACLEQAWRELPAAEAKTLWEKLPRFPRSVVTDLHLVRLALLRGDLDRTVVEELLVELFDREKGEALIDSFLAALRWVDRELNRWPPHHSLPPWQRLVLVWYHASKLHGIFRATGVDLDKMEQWFAENTSSWHHGVMDHDPAYMRDLSNPNLVGPGSVVLNGLANLLERLPEADVDALGVPAKWKALAEKDAPFAGSVLLDLSRRTDLASNVLGAFVAQGSPAMRNRLMGPDWDAMLRQAGVIGSLGELISNAAKDPYGVAGWPALLASMRELPVPEEDRAALRELLLAIDWEEFAVKTPQWLRVVMTFAAAQARNLDAEFRQKFEKILFNFAGGPTRAKMSEAEARLVDVHVAQALLALSIEPGDQVKTATVYFEKVGRLMRVQPAVALLLEGPMRHWLSRLPFEQQRGLRALWYQMRAQS
jgi:tetratricopeptide (TPR) repeat protein